MDQRRLNSPFIYLTLHQTIHTVKRLMKKVSTYIVIVYYVLLLVLLSSSVDTMNEWIASGLLTGGDCIFAFYALIMVMAIPSNLGSFCKRKGLVFYQADVNFLFSQPISPKKILVYSCLRNIVSGIFLQIIWFGYWAILLRLNLFLTILAALFCTALNHTFTCCMAVLIFGNEAMSERTNRILRNVIRVGMFSLIIIAVGLCVFSYQKGVIYMWSYVSNHPAILCFPVIGWELAMISLLFRGATFAAVLGSSLFLISIAVFIYLARRVPCTGEYFEEAMEYADELETAIERNKKGEAVVRIGKKKEKLRELQGGFRCQGAAVLMERQLMEYRKKRFFFFNTMSVFMFLGGILISVFQWDWPYNPIIIPIIIAYITLFFSTLGGEIKRELELPFAYMLPVSPFKKLFYMKVMDVCKACADTALITVVAAFGLGLTPIQVILTVVIGGEMKAFADDITVITDLWLANVVGLLRNYLRTIPFILMDIGLIVIGIIFCMSGQYTLALLWIVLYMLICCITMHCIASCVLLRMEMPGT